MDTSDKQTRSSRVDAVDTAEVTHAATIIRRSRRTRRLLSIFAPLVLALTVLVTPGIAIAAGDGELQIGDAIYTETGRHVLADDTPIASNGQGSTLLADGSVIAAGDEDTSGTTEFSQCGSVRENRSFSPVVRWAASDAYQEHHNSLSDNILKSAARAIPAGISMTASIPGDIGNAAWGMTAQITGFSSDFCPIVAMGPRIDLLAGTIGEVVLDSGLGAFILIGAIVLIGWRLIIGHRQGGGALKAAARALIIPILMGSLLVVMVGAATSGLTNRDEAQGIYEPQFMSPGWVLTKTSSTLGAVINVPMQALSSSAVTDVGLSPDSNVSADARGAGSCSATIDLWRSEAAKERHDVSPATDTISDLWAYGGVPYYVNYQFGGADNELGWYAYCRVLDANANSYTAADRADTDYIDGTWNEAFRDDYELPGTGGLNIMDSGALPKMKVTGDDQDQLNDAAILGWLVCRTDDGGKHWSLVDGATNISGQDGLVTSGEEMTTQACVDWWTADEESEVPDSMLLEPGEDGAVETGNADLDEALTAMHSTPSVPFADGIGLMISGIVALIIFGIISLVVMVSKVGFIVMGLFMIGAVVIGMWADTGQHLKRYGLSTLGLLLVSILAQAIFVVVAVLSKILLSIGGTFFLSSVFMMAMWAAISPLVAILILHFGSKSLIGTSPFTLRGAKTLATKGIDPGMLAGMAAAGSGVTSSIARGRAAQQDRQKLASADAMRSGSAQLTAPQTGKHDGVGAMTPAGEANAVPSSTAEGQSVAAGGASAGASGGASRRAQSQEMGSMVAAMRRARAKGKGHEERAPGTGLLGQIGQAADKAAADPEKGTVGSTGAALRASAGEARRGIAGSARESMADRQVLAAQRRARWQQMSGLEKAAHRTGQAGSLAKGIGSTAWRHKGKVGLAAGVGAVTVASAGTVAPALALGALAASGYGAKRAVGSAVSHPERARARHALADQAIRGMGEGSVLSQRMQARQDRATERKELAEFRQYAPMSAGGGMSARILDRVRHSGDGSLRGTDAVVAGRLAAEQQRQDEQAQIARAAEQAEARGENAGSDKQQSPGNESQAQSGDDDRQEPSGTATVGQSRPVELGGESQGSVAPVEGSDRAVPPHVESVPDATSAPVADPAPTQSDAPAPKGDLPMSDAPAPKVDAPAPKADEPASGAASRGGRHSARSTGNEAGSTRPQGPSRGEPSGPAQLGGAPEAERKDGQQ